jgi:predicted secreted protein
MLITLRKKLFKKIGFENIYDCRSRRLVAVIECILNQNARDCGAANFPAINRPILDLCNDYNIGILQIPCPEIKFLGFDRKRQKDQSIREALDTQEGRNCCRKISIDVADRIQEYFNQSYQTICILGGNPKSPGCAVHYAGTKLSTDSGVLMNELFDEFQKRNINLPFRGVSDYDSKLFSKDIEWIHRKFSNRTVSDS